MPFFMQSPNADYKSFLTNEELFNLFCQNKSKISTIENPLMFLRHLKDNGFITDELYKNLENSGGEDHLYPVLEYIQKRGTMKIRKFWECVDQKHILQLYPELSEVTAALRNLVERDQEHILQCFPQLLEVTPALNNSPQNELNNEMMERSEDPDTGKGKQDKKRKTGDSATPQAGASAQSQEDMCEDVERAKKNKNNLWDRPEHKKWLPVKCGNKEARLDREALRHYGKKRDCIKYGRERIAPYVFEELGGRGKWKSWKTSITCQDKTIKELLEKGVLKMPAKKKRNI